MGVQTGRGQILDADRFGQQVRQRWLRKFKDQAFIAFAIGETDAIWISQRQQ